MAGAVKVHQLPVALCYTSLQENTALNMFKGCNVIQYCAKVSTQPLFYLYFVRK